MKTIPCWLTITAIVALQITAARAVVFTSNTTIDNGDQTYEAQDIVVSNCTLTVNGPHAFASLQLTDNAVLRHSPAPTGDAANAVNLTIAQDATIEAGSRIDVSALGFSAQSGPGLGTYSFYGGSGAGYGGEGGGGGTSYGSVVEPVDFGSGGGNGGYGPGGAGGGVVRLGVGGTLTVSGQILADGQDIGGGYGAGGAGGSVYLTTETLTGSGEIRTTGGDGANGGSGGRIALYYAASTFSGTKEAFGGGGNVRGGAGTIYLKSAASVGRVLVDNGGLTGAETPLLSPVVFDLTVTHAGIVRPQAALNLASLLVAPTGMVVHPSAQPGFALVVQGDATVEDGGAILASCDLTIHGNLLIATGGVISANGKGFGTDAGPGKGNVDYYHPSGAGYGGLGGNAGTVGGTVYGSLLQPVDLGSGGGNAGVCGGSCPGGTGGGAIRLDVDNNLTINGQLTANGTSGSGGGSGGSLMVSTGILTGSGMFSASGGGGGGGGGGGRIALYYGNNTFTGSVSAIGGQGGTGYSGGPGTIYTKRNNQEFGALLIDGSGRTNAMETPVTSPVPFDLILSNTTVYPDGALLVGSLLMATNATLTHPAGGPRMQITVLGNATIDAGAAVDVDGRGYGSTAGPGHGNASYYYGSGAGYGGPGGASTNDWGDLLPGGAAYGSETMPVELGSGGGSAGICGPCPGGAGGGAIQLTVAGTLVLNGHMTANGKDGAGGGSGGSVFLTVGQLAGSGVIAVNGGATGIYQGGGAGGRIAIYSGQHSLTGAVTANGGTGGYSGGSGTIYYSDNVAPVVTSQYPSGPITRFVSYIDLTFNQPVDPASFTTDDLILTGPSGPIPNSQLTLTGGGGVTWRIAFPTQFANGTYTLTVGPNITNLFGQQIALADVIVFTVNFTTPIVSISQTGGNLSLNWSSVSGLSYQLQSTTDLLAASWINEGQPMKGTGGPLSISQSIGVQPKKFFRLWLLEN